MATKKRAMAKRASTKRGAAIKRRTQPGRYKGLYLRVTRNATTKSRKALDEGRILMAVGDADSDGWVPIIFRGSVEYVRSADVSRIRS